MYGMKQASGCDLNNSLLTVLVHDERVKKRQKVKNKIEGLQYSSEAGKTSDPH